MHLPAYYIETGAAADPGIPDLPSLSEPDREDLDAYLVAQAGNVIEAVRIDRWRTGAVAAGFGVVAGALLVAGFGRGGWFR